MTDMVVAQHNQQRDMGGMRWREDSTLSLHLLGGFRVECGVEVIPDAMWRRRSAKTLVKVLAIQPEHRMHRDQLLELLWPDADPASVLPNLYQALSAARRVLEGGGGRPLRCSEGMVALDSRQIWLDVDHFQTQAVAAIRSGDPALLDAAVATYGGELLPEDRYEEWAISRREDLARLYGRLLLTLAEEWAQRGELGAAIERIHQALALDPTREDLHRRLMQLYLRSGSRHQALRQFQDCVRVLRQELEVEPEEETQALYQAILAGEVRPDRGRGPAPLPAALHHCPAGPFVGRERALEVAQERLDRAAGGAGSLVLVSGEAGVGKSRLAAELVSRAQQEGWLVLWGGSYAEEGALPYGPFVEAFDQYLSAHPELDRDELITVYPELLRLLPMHTAGRVAPPLADGARTRLFADVVHFLARLAQGQPVFLVVDDLHVADRDSIHLLHYLARTAPRHPWLLLGTYREEEVVPGSGCYHLTLTGVRQGLARHLELLGLSPSETTLLVEALLDGARVERGLLDQLYAVTLGNPLFLKELVQTLRESDFLSCVRGVWRSTFDITRIVPRGVGGLVAARVARLPAEAARMLALAAVAGMESSFTLLRDAGGFSEEGAVEALDHILAAQLMEERGEGYAFRHPLIRRALYERLSSTRRTYWQARLQGTTLRTSSPPGA